MKGLLWVEVDNKLIAEMQYGRAIIEPYDLALDDKAYRLRLVLPSGELLSEWAGDLENAKSYAWVNLTRFDKVEGALGECGFIEETLKLCQQSVVASR